MIASKRINSWNQDDRNTYLNVLRRIDTRLKDADLVWVITGSVGMAQQGMNILVHDIYIQTDEQLWEEPVRVEEYRQWVELEGMRIPGLSLEYEYQAYFKLGRIEKTQMMKE